MHKDHYSHQQRKMSSPPQGVLSTKDCAYLTDALSWELLATKKAHNMAMQCSDRQIKHKLEQIGNLHQNHYNILLNHLTTSQHDHSHQSYQNFPQ